MKRSVILAALLLVAGPTFVTAIPARAQTAAVYQFGLSAGRGSARNLTPTAVSLPGVPSWIDAEDTMNAAIVNGDVYTWGDDKNGQLGNGHIGHGDHPPIKVPGLSNIVSTTGGDNWLMALGANGNLYAWGNNSAGNLCDGNQKQLDSPRLVATGIAQIQGGNLLAILLTQSGTVETCGSSENSELGNGNSTEAALTPTPVTVTWPAPDSVVAISAGCRFASVLLSDGSVWSWGLNDWGQVLPGSTKNQAVPVQVPGLPPISQVSAGGGSPDNGHQLALDQNGNVWAWGNNESGQLGVGDVAAHISVVEVPGLTGITSATAGGQHSMALGADGTLYTWGGNSKGQLGDGTTTGHASPEVIMSGVSLISAGSEHSLAS